MCSKMQRRATKLIPSVFALPYESRSEKLGIHFISLSMFKRDELIVTSFQVNEFILPD